MLIYKYVSLPVTIRLLPVTSGQCENGLSCIDRFCTKEGKQILIVGGKTVDNNNKLARTRFVLPLLLELLDLLEFADNIWIDHFGPRPLTGI